MPVSLNAHEYLALVFENWSGPTSQDSRLKTIKKKKREALNSSYPEGQ